MCLLFPLTAQFVSLITISDALCPRDLSSYKYSLLTRGLSVRPRTSTAQQILTRLMFSSTMLIYIALIWTAQSNPTTGLSEVTSCKSSRLHEAVASGDKGLIKDAVRSGMDLYAKDCYGMTAMELALRLEDDGAANALLEGSYNLDNADVEGITLMLRAVNRGDRHLFQKLREFGCSVDLLSSNDSTPFLEALLTGREDMLELLLKAGATLDFELPNGDTYLHRVVELENFSSAVKLLKFEVPLDEKNFKDETPMTKAVLKDNAAFVNLLLKSGADISRRNKLGENYFHLAISGNKTKVLPVFLRVDILLYEETLRGQTPLFYAVKQNNAEIVRALVKRGASLNRLNRFGETYLDMAGKNRTLLVQFFDLGVSPDLRNGNDWTIMSKAVVEEDLDTMELLHTYGSDVNHKVLYKYYSNGQYIRECRINLLHLAAAVGSSKAAEWLLSHGVVINAKCCTYTPLDMAILEYKEDCAKRLLELGACDDYEASDCEQSYSLAQGRSYDLPDRIHSKKKSKGF